MIYCKFPNRSELKDLILLPFIFIYQIRLLLWPNINLWGSECQSTKICTSTFVIAQWFLNIFLHVLDNNLKKVEYWPTFPSFQAFNDYQNNNFSLPSLHSFRAKKGVLMTKSDVMNMWYIHQTTLRTEFYPVSFVGDTFKSTKPQSYNA